MAQATRLLIDSSVLLEFLLDQERADEVASFFKRTPQAALYITDFAFHSVALILVSRKHGKALGRLVDDLLGNRGVVVLSLTPSEVVSLADRTGQLNLDFDDAYQYVAAEKHDLTLVSFDADFDRTARGRKTPKALLDSLEEEPGPDFVARDRPAAVRRRKAVRDR